VLPDFCNIPPPKTGLALLRNALWHIRLYRPRRQWPSQYARAFVAWVRTKGQG